MATAVNTHSQPKAKGPESFFDRHFTKIALAVSTLAMLILAPLHLFLGTVAGLAIHSFSEPDLRLKPTDSIITLPNALFAIVGATASFIGMTPAGALGGFIFKAIPFISSFAIGSTVYRTIAPMTN